MTDEAQKPDTLLFGAPEHTAFSEHNAEQYAEVARQAVLALAKQCEKAATASGASPTEQLTFGPGVAAWGLLIAAIELIKAKSDDRIAHLTALRSLSEGLFGSALGEADVQLRSRIAPLVDDNWSALCFGSALQDQVNLRLSKGSSPSILLTHLMRQAGAIIGLFLDPDDRKDLVEKSLKLLPTYVDEQVALQDEADRERRERESPEDGIGKPQGTA